MRTPTHTRTTPHTCVCTHACTRTHTAHTSTPTHTYMCTHAHARTHTHTHTHVHTRMHIHTHAQSTMAHTMRNTLHKDGCNSVCQGVTHLHMGGTDGSCLLCLALVVLAGVLCNLPPFVDINHLILIHNCCLLHCSFPLLLGLLLCCLAHLQQKQPFQEGALR